MQAVDKLHVEGHCHRMVTVKVKVKVKVAFQDQDTFDASSGPGTTTTAISAYLRPHFVFDDSAATRALGKLHLLHLRAPTARACLPHDTRTCRSLGDLASKEQRAGHAEEAVANPA